MLVNIRKKLSELRTAYRLFSAWKKLKVVAEASASQAKGTERVLIIPCDPWSVVGSRGDQAMILATCQSVHGKYPGTSIDVLCDSHATDAVVRELGLNPIVHWCPLMGDWFEKNASTYRAVYILGADVTDGVYGWITSMNLLAMYDLFTRAGVEARYLGFSFSTRPASVMRKVFSRLRDGLPLPVRDPVSFERVKSFTRHRPVNLIADAAFCLQPCNSRRIERDVAWCNAERERGRKVLALNVHPMFNDVGGSFDEWKRCFIEVMCGLLERDERIALMFLPHDDRPNVSDVALLTEVFKQMHRRFSDRIHLVETVYRADEIKAIVGRCDALLAGRMHLSIAALGQCVPVFAFVYQGKFEGLWRHFDLTDETLCEPRDFVRKTDEVKERLSTFIDRLPAVRDMIKSRLPTVMALSQSQFE